MVIKLIDFQIKWTVKLQLLIEELKKLPKDVVMNDIKVLTDLCESLTKIETPRDLMLFITTCSVVLRNEVVKDPKAKSIIRELLEDIKNVDEHGGFVITIKIAK